MLEVDKIEKSVLAFVNFFAGRIVLAILLALFVRLVSGDYYFHLIESAVASSGVLALDLSSPIAKASAHFDDKNVKNALFGAALVVALSLLDILYRVILFLGRLIPIGMNYDATYSTLKYQSSIAGAWRFYHKNFSFFEFQAFLQEKVGNVLREIASYSSWWLRLFRFTKAFIVVLFVLVVLTPRDELRVTGFQALLFCVGGLMVMTACTMIESARYANDVGSAIRKVSLTMRSEAEDEPISEDELREEMAKIKMTGPMKLRWKNKFFCVRMTVHIPYVGSLNDLFSRAQESGFTRYSSVALAEAAERHDRDTRRPKPTKGV
ncbi:hypothetical protein ML401_20640 [Bradyrhizobium sp. 62B]|uniref:hypothetical protein n=1 Tax=Bradyrhizobium sp. 62B TaxID=2898442 RepID=UPI00255839B6|nr:hypothetical protein ML401_20640 [Bradyrhizobium sp. 62B]